MGEGSSKKRWVGFTGMHNKTVDIWVVNGEITQQHAYLTSAPKERDGDRLSKWLG